MKKNDACPVSAMLSLSLAVMSTSVWAEESQSASDIKVTGLVDIYYGFNANRPNPVSPPSLESPFPSPQNGGRNFDLFHNQLGLNMVELSLQKSAGEVSFKADFDFGEMTDWIHGPGGGFEEVSKHLGQAVLSYSPKAVPGLTLNFGKMATHMGYELIKARDNWQYSRSFLFSLAIPYWHSGVCANYAVVPERVSTGLFLYNGWNNLFANTTGKTVGAQVGLVPIPGVSFYYNVITGPGAAGADRRTVHEANLVVPIIPDRITVAMDGALGVSTAHPIGDAAVDARWRAATVALKYQAGPRFYLSPRVGIYHDQQGVTTGFGSGIHLTEATLTNSYLISDKLEGRLELRRDTADGDLFAGKDGSTNTQSTGTLALLFSF